MKSFDSRLISTINTIEGWSTNDIVSTLVGNIVDISYHKFTGYSITKEITLIQHEAISIYIRVMVFNSDRTKIYIKIDDVLISTTSYTDGWLQKIRLYFNFIYSEYLLDYLSSQYIAIQERKHINLKIKITVEVAMNKNPSLSTWFGIRDFQIFLTPYNLVADMKNKVVQNYYTCDDSNIYPFDGCFSQMYDCVEGCSNCIFGVCYECQGGWEYMEHLRKCYPICGDSVITYNEECDDSNVISNGCEFCKLSCPSLCKTCNLGNVLNVNNHICQLIILAYQLVNIIKITKYKNNKDAITKQKILLILDFIMNQKNQYYFDYYNLRIYKNMRLLEYRQYQHAQLNSNIVIFTTDCLVHNYQIFAFQYQICSVIRVNNCKIQYQEFCIECMEGYHLERNKKNCIPQCNDGIIAETEECDDKNNIQFDKCYKCQQSCQLECQICIKEKCLVCLESWQLIDDICVPKCGDGIIALGSQEQCDDGNQIDKDGCNMCMWQCSPYCKQCINQNLCDKCIDIVLLKLNSKLQYQNLQQCILNFYQSYFQNPYNFELIGLNECQPICGDSIVIPRLEECDDGNEVPFDGCFECQFQCETNCVLCEFGDCQQSCKPDQIIVNGSCKNESDDSSQIDEMEEDENNNNYSFQECGDGRQSQKEECDDGNDINNDGCSNICQVEVNWNCTEIQSVYSKCFPITDLQISFLNQSFEYQYVQISYDKQVKTQGNPKDFISTIKSEIYLLKPKEYQIKIYPV